jgi:hypothetical protein
MTGLHPSTVSALMLATLPSARPEPKRALFPSAINEVVAKNTLPMANGVQGIGVASMYT